MIELIEMKEHEFKQYLDFMIPDYAKDISNNYNLSMDKAFEESEVMMKELLPDGISTEGQFLYNIYDPQLNKQVGILWFDINKEINRAYLYHIFINEDCRQRGYATKAIEKLQKRVKEFGMNSIALSVFGKNKNAQELYEKMGYSVSSISMYKLL